MEVNTPLDSPLQFSAVACVAHATLLGSSGSASSSSTVMPASWAIAFKCLGRGSDLPDSHRLTVAGVVLQNRAKSSCLNCALSRISRIFSAKIVCIIGMRLKYVSFNYARNLQKCKHQLKKILALTKKV